MEDQLEQVVRQKEQTEVQVHPQIAFTVMQIKIQLLALAKDLIKELGEENDKTLGAVQELYRDLRKEVLGISNE